MAQNEHDLIRTRENEHERLLKQLVHINQSTMTLHRPERYVFLGLGVIGFLLLVVGTIFLLLNAKFEISTMTTLFGSGGLFATGAGGTNYYFNKSYKLIEAANKAYLDFLAAKGGVNP